MSEEPNDARDARPRPDVREDAGVPPIEYGRGNAWTRPPTRARGAAMAGVFSTLILGLAVVFGGMSAYEQPEKRGMVLVAWGVGLAIVLVIIGLAHWRGTPGVIPGALAGIALTGLFAGWCYSAS